MRTVLRPVARPESASRVILVLLAIVGIGLAGAGCGGGGGGDYSGTSTPAPTLTSVTPSNGTVGTELSIVGTGFRSGVQVFVGGMAMSSVERASTTQIFAFVPAGIVTGVGLDVTVRNSDNQDATLSAAFIAVAPTLQFVNSATKPSDNVGSTVIIEGAAFGDIQGSGEVLFSDGAGGTISAVIANEDDWIDTFIVTTVPSGAEDGPIAVTTATGTSNTLWFDVTEAATFSPSTIEWTVTEDLLVRVSGHDVAFVPIEDAGGVTNSFVYVLGGASDDGVPLAEVNFAAVQANGTVGAWNTTSPLPAGRAFHGLVAATPFNSKVDGHGELYVLGGIDTVGGQPVTTVYRASLNEDGTVGDWSESEPLPEPLHSLGAVIFRGAIYVAGGATTDNEPVASVYRARPDTLAALSAWEALPALPSPRAYHDLATFGGFVYAVGGETAAVSPDDGEFLNNDTKSAEVAYVAIDLRTGDFADTAWTVNANELEKKRSKHSMLVAGGNIFVTSGLYNGAGTGSTENVYAPINADGSVESFVGATGSNTLFAAGGANLFNQAALSYVDADGVAHVMVLGGDNVNLPGNKRTKVMFY